MDNRGYDDNRDEIKFIGKNGFVVFNMGIKSIDIKDGERDSEYVLCTTIKLQKNS